MIYFFIGLSFLISSEISASTLGNEVGNGGNVVVCHDEEGNVASVELLDFFEARALRGSTFVNEDKSESEILKNLLENLAKKDKRRKEYLKRYYEYFKENTQFITQEGGLISIDDSHHLVEPLDKCEVSQVAIYNKSALKGDRKLLVGEGLWSEMDSLNRVGLLIHEAVYRYLALTGEKDSVNSRFYTSMVLSDEFNAFTSDDYWKTLRESNIAFYRN